MNVATIPPPLVYLSSAALGVVFDWLVPLAGEFPGWGRLTGVGLIVASIAIMPPVLSRFRSARTPFDVRKKPSALITTGPFRFSRNPSYVGLTVLYVGIGLAAGSAGMLLLGMFPVIVLDRWVIPLEEDRLVSEFGDAYTGYQARVRRWL